MNRAPGNQASSLHSTSDQAGGHQRPYLRRQGHRPSLRSQWFNHLLRRVIRRQLARCHQIEQMRRSVDRMAWLSPQPRSLQRQPVCINQIPCEWLQVPQSHTTRVILYLHGGGFCVPAMSGQFTMMTRLCRLSRSRALLVDYRLAPEHPFPAAVNDCFAAYQGLLAEGVKAGQIVLCGDSAGGNLLMGVLQQARAAGLPLPAGGVLMSPSTDATTLGAKSHAMEARDPFFSLAIFRRMGSWYLPASCDTTDPLISPVFGDLSGLPPLMIHVGELEMLHGDSVKLAHKAHQDGVAVQLHSWPGMPHVFPAFPLLPEARQALQQMAGFITTCLESPLREEKR